MSRGDMRRHRPNRFSSEIGYQMTNRDTYDKVFMDSFSVPRDALNAEFVYQCVPAWDSVGHMGMIAALEEAFDIMMDTEDIIEFGSYTIGVEKLKKYGVEL
jgi:acyl carrier protein